MLDDGGYVLDAGAPVSGARGGGDVRLHARRVLDELSAVRDDVMLNNGPFVCEGESQS